MRADLAHNLLILCCLHLIFWYWNQKT